MKNRDMKPGSFLQKINIVSYPIKYEDKLT